MSRFGGKLHVDSSEEGVVTSHAMVMIGEEVRILVFLLFEPGLNIATVPCCHAMVPWYHVAMVPCCNSALVFAI